MKLDGKEIHKRGKKLASLRKRARRELEQNPELTAEQLSEMLGVNKSTAYAWKSRWKSRKEKQKREEIAAKPERQKELNPFDVADALLKRVVDVLTKYDRALSEIAELREYKSRVFELERELKTEKGEKERILKIHNQQAQRNKLVSTEELCRLANVR